MPTYKLTYFNGKGLAELSRLLFVYADVKYEDNRMKDREEFMTKYKPILPNGQVPCLEVDGKMYAQSSAIARFLAREFNLYGKSNLESLEVDVVLETVTDIRTALMPVMRENDEDKKAELKKKAVTEGIPPVLEKLEKLVGDSDVFVGETITFADIGFFRMLEMAKGHNEAMLNDYPKLTAVFTKVSTEPKIAAWLAIRPVTPW